MEVLKQVQNRSGLELRLALVTARNAPAHERALRTLDDWGLEVDEAFFLGGLKKAPFLKEFGPDLFFDDQTAHTKPAEGIAAVAHVPFGIRNRRRSDQAESLSAGTSTEQLGLRDTRTVSKDIDPTENLDSISGSVPDIAPPKARRA